MNHIELERLMCAAAVDRQFRELLLREPLRAAEGYYTERFLLTAEEKAFIASIRVNDFGIFVRLVADWIWQSRSSRRVHAQRERSRRGESFDNGLTPVLGIDSSDGVLIQVAGTDLLMKRQLVG